MRMNILAIVRDFELYMQIKNAKLCRLDIDTATFLLVEHLVMRTADADADADPRPQIRLDGF